MPMNILVADDSVTMRRIMELTFAGEDVNVTSVDSGDAAIARAAEVAPDVVFADVSMHTDGYKVASAIKATPGLERTAVIVLASQKHPYDEVKGKAAGVDDHVIKPFDTQHVIDKVKRVLTQPRAAAARPVQAAAPAVGMGMGMPAQARPSRTVAFERAPVAMPMPPAAHAAPARPVPAAAAKVGAVTVSDLARKLDGLGLTAEQVEGVLALSREVIEKVVWEVVPDLAETLIREEIRRLTQ